MTNSPSRIPSLPLSRFTEEGKGFSNLCMYNKSTHIDQKRQSSKSKKNSEENCTNLPWKNQSGKKHNQQKVQLHESWDAKLEELKNPENLMSKSQSKKNFPFKKSTSRRQYSL
jgi:hypothetical protein